MTAVIQQKLERFRSEAPRVLDLFSGCGGLSLGFLAAGFDIVGAVEIDPIASASHARNFHSTEPESVRALHGHARDITALEPAELVKELGLGPEEAAVDVIVGGPPCQAFARVGRAKLREVANHPEAFLKDPRSNLYLRYLHYVRRLRPLVLLMENVPDVLNYGGHNIAEEMCEVLEDLGYVASYTLLNAVHYGVPQMRERAFLLAYHKEIGQPIRFPRPTHWVDLPRGYEGTRSVALKTVTYDLFNQTWRFVSSPKASPSLPQAVTAREALEDLPRITLHLEGKLRRGTRRFDVLAPYRKDEHPSPYAQLMRNWPGFESKDGVWDHVIRYLPRDYAIFRIMKPGDQYPEAYKHAAALFEKRARAKKVRRGTAAYRQLWKETVPPYDPNKFPNKWRKMEADRPARTLMAHIGKDSYTHIHYDSSQARTISVREAARLQSFPDGFVLEGSMNPAFRQIGNAVPPLQARAIAAEMLQALRKAGE